MSWSWRDLFPRLAAAPAPRPVPLPPAPPAVPPGVGWPRTFTPPAPGGPDQPRLFDPALLHYRNAFRAGDPTFPDRATELRWAGLRWRATDHVLRAVAESAWGDRLILRGSRLLRAWLGADAREPGDLDWVADPPAARPADPNAVRMFDEIAAAVLDRPAPYYGLVFDRGGVATDDIWTYERAPGRRIVFPWRVDGLPGGRVQVDVVFGEELAEPDRRESVPAADGGCVSVRAGGPAQSLAWKLLWLMTDMHPQGKDLYDAVLLAERFPLPLGVLEATLRRGDAGPPPVTAAGLTRDWRVDWGNFRPEHPAAGADAAGWLTRLETALGPTFAADPVPPPAGPAVDPAWLTEAVVGLARGIDAERAFDRLPILADALEDAGCADEDVLAHCRTCGPHTRWCAVVDRLLGRA